MTHLIAQLDKKYDRFYLQHLQWATCLCGLHDLIGDQLAEVSHHSRDISPISQSIGALKDQIANFSGAGLVLLHLVNAIAVGADNFPVQSATDRSPIGVGQIVVPAVIPLGFHLIRVES